jgi:Zn-dependent M28 family amino/carboxypeptidase
LTLVLLAHYDSKSQNLTLPWRLGASVGVIVAGPALVALLIAGVVRGVPFGPVWLAPALGGAVALALLALSTLRNENESPGGTDNAGSVAILCELARTLPAEIDDDVELIFLAPSAEEDHMVGAQRWLEAHLEQERATGAPVLALNLDGAGSPGRAVIMEWYGGLEPFGRKSASAARRVAARLGIPMRRIWLLPVMGVDGIPFARRGVECITFSSGSLGRATIAVHSKNDVAEHLCEETLDRCYRLVQGTAVELARTADA